MKHFERFFFYGVQGYGGKLSVVGGYYLTVAAGSGPAEACRVFLYFAVSEAYIAYWHRDLRTSGLIVTYDFKTEEVYFVARGNSAFSSCYVYLLFYGVYAV